MSNNIALHPSIKQRITHYQSHYRKRFKLLLFNVIFKGYNVCYTVPSSAILQYSTDSCQKNYYLMQILYAINL